MKNKKTVVVIIACIALVVTFTMLVSYAYWRVSKTQTGTNEILGACLDIRLDEDLDENDDLIEGFTLDNAWPISDQEGTNLEGYHFTIVNTCEESVTYQVVLDSLNIDNEINNEYVKVELDNGGIYKYGLLEDAPIDEGLEYTPKLSKGIYTGTVPGTTNNEEGKVEHTIKIWISDDAPNDEIGKSFSSKVRVMAGQNLPTPEYALTPESCFEFDSETGTITGYDEENCTTDYLVLPAAINGVMVRNIDFIGDATQASQCHDCNIHWEYIDLTKATGLKEINECAFFNYFGSNKKLIIPNNVELIGDSAFYSYIGTGQELIIPDSVVTIGNSAFRNYNGTKLTLGNSVEQIGVDTFIHYVGTGQELIIPDSVREIAPFAFQGFKGEKMVLGTNVVLIGNDSFYSYEGADQELVIPDSTENISQNAFVNFKGTKLTLGESVKNIEASAFGSYVGIGQELVIPDNVERIFNRAFENFKGDKLTLGHSLTNIGDSAFYSYIGAGQELIIPDNVKYISTHAFYNYNGTKLTLGNSLININDCAFSCYVGTGQELIIPNSVRMIFYSAFFSFAGDSLTIGSGIVHLDAHAFNDYINTININMTEAQFASVDKSDNWKNNNAVLNYLQ